ncbi:hypothetical protein B9Z55_018744 [Caenorhabditis nigoni]|uniref:Uncharacterized protein n=1 Tax=Caenorhabditis nigoni TaxID=1611254 RepID=A0A2G5TG61_9PELO|nr:hypothetical protein B9Z55_018744 [Caenorhabditis nigoni]
MRSFLAAIIAIERVVATMVPLKFYYYRRRISNAPVIVFIISAAVAVEVVLFGFCGFRLPLPVGCTTYACATPPCYLTYAAVTKMIYGSVNATFSILLCAKIFLLSWRQASVQTDLRRVNWISLTDGLSTLSFDVLPTMIFDSRIIDITGYGPIVGVLRQSGRAVEAMVMVKLMERKKVVPVARISVSAKNIG